METYDFSGYATKNDLTCSDGRVIRRNAFKDNHGKKVPLVWQHSHDDPNNVLGHAYLENREDGVYAYCKLNNSLSGQQARELVKHGDVNALSIYANKLKQKGNDVLHGAIREVSIVLSGANPGALIDNVTIAHSDGDYSVVEDEAVLYTGSLINREAGEMANLQHGEEEENDMDDKTVQDVFDSMTEEQKNVLYYMVGQALESKNDDGDDSEEENDEDVEHSGFFTDDAGNLYTKNEEGQFMKHNVFQGGASEGMTLSHSDVTQIFSDAQKSGSLKEAVLSHAQTYGIEDIDILFPDAKNVLNSPEFIKRDDAWVNKVIGSGGVKSSPFARIKSTAADITEDEARAKGYIKGKKKKEEVFSLLKRVTTPTTIYKKQKLDRDDIIDITDLNVVAWLKQEMRMMLNEELARAILIGDGRSITSDDKIKEDNIRPIYTDDELYSVKVQVQKNDPSEIIDTIVRSRKEYKGVGNPTMFTTTDVLTDMLLMKDTLGRRLYSTEAELASALRVSEIIEVPVMENVSRETDDGELDLIAILVNMSDYVVGADAGGKISMFDDFDIDFNQYKYLIETRCSGALVKPKTAIVIESPKSAGEARVFNDKVSQE